MREITQESSKTTAAAQVSGFAGWLLKRLSRVRKSPARLAVLDRISLAPRQSLALVEAEGRRFLVATSPEGTPAFHALEPLARRSGRNLGNRDLAGRISW